MQVKMSYADFSEKEKANVSDVMESGWLSRHKYIPRFEDEVARIHGAKHGMMTNSGTDALRIGIATLKEVGGWSDGDEVIVPAVTFVATVNAVLQNNLTPVFVDVDRATYNLDATKIAEAVSSDTKCIIPVHLFGLPADMESVMTVANSLDLDVLEDSCECFGVHQVQGDMAAFSFYMAHHIQCGVGGVLAMKDEEHDQIARSLMNHGRSTNADKFEFERIGYSSRVTELEAAVGCGQLERWESILFQRRSVVAKLMAGLKGTEEIQLPIQHWTGKELDHSWMLFPVVLLKGDRDKLMAYLLEKGIESRQMMPLINQACYSHLVDEEDYPVAKWINQNGICLPCHQKLTDDQIVYMVETVKGFFKNV
jgi:perosamine synthetase